MPVLRFLMVLCLVVWIGGIVFFGAVLAPTVFTVLPTHELAGRVVARSLAALHWMGVVSGLVYLLVSVIYSLRAGASHPLAARHLLILLMIALTLFSQLVISAKMNSMRLQLGAIDQVAQTDPMRIEFNRLHQWSTRVEMAVLALGLVVTYMTVARLHS